MTCNVVNRKWATLKDNKIKMQLNGFVMNTSVDKVDELFDEGIIRYFVNHVLYQLDVQRQIHFEEDKEEKRPAPDSHANQASIEEHKIYCQVVLEDHKGKPGFFQKGVRGVAWDIHETQKMDTETINNIKYAVDPEKGELSILEERDEKSN